MPSNKRYTLIQKQYRKRYLALQKKLEKEYGSISGKLMGNIQKLAFKYAGEDGKLPKAKLRRLQLELSKMNRQYSKELKELIDRNVVTSANIAIQGQDAAAEHFVKSFIKEASDDEKKILRKALIDSKSGVLLGAYGTGLDKAVRKAVWEKRWQDGYRLSDRIWKLHSTMDVNLKSMVEQCVNQGKSAVNFSKAVERYLEKPGPAWTTAIKPSITGKGSVKYNALRLARTETNNAYRMAHQASAKGSVIVKGIKWNLSASHPHYDYEEICELYAENDIYGLGNGVFPPDAVPISPHPNCMCYLTDVLYEGDELINRIKEKYELNQ